MTIVVLRDGRQFMTANYVPPDELGAIAELLLHRLAEIGVEIAEHDAGPAGHEHLDDRLPDAARTARDDRDLTVE